MQFEDPGSDAKYKELETLDVEVFKRVLDEAYRYRAPKDKEGTSVLFQNLLAVAEEKEKQEEEQKKNQCISWTQRHKKDRKLRKKDSAEEAVRGSAASGTKTGGSLNNLHDCSPETKPRGRRNKDGSVALKTRGGGSCFNLSKGSFKPTAAARSSKGGSQPNLSQADCSPNQSNGRNDEGAPHKLQKSGSTSSMEVRCDKSISNSVQPKVGAHVQGIENEDGVKIFDQESQGSVDSEEHKSEEVEMMEIDRSSEEESDHKTVIPVDKAIAYSALNPKNGMVRPDPDMQDGTNLDSIIGPRTLSHKGADEDKKKKGLKNRISVETTKTDENGNPYTLNAISGPNNEYQKIVKRREQKRAKKSKNVMEVKADEIEGYRGHEQISDILQYIETPKDKKKGRNSTEKKNQENARRPPRKDNPKGRRDNRREDDDEPETKTHHKTSSIGGVDDIDKLVFPTLKRSSSFGEMPCDMSPFEGTSMRTEYNEDPEREDDGSFCDVSLDSSLQKSREEEPKKVIRGISPGSGNLEEMDFKVVKRSKRKSKEKKVVHKGSDDSYKGFLEYEGSSHGWKNNAMLFMNLAMNHRQNEMIKLASSAPPSDHSDCSDVDSVCSLPAGSTTPKPCVDKKSTSTDCTPHSSYAEITKMKPTKYPISPPEKMNEYMHAGTQTANKDQEVTPNGPKSKLPTVPFEMPSLTTVIKKDAMTCTSQDYSLVSKQASAPPSVPADILPSDKSSEPAIKETVLECKEVNVLADYYPSLEEVSKMKWKEKGVSAIEMNGTSGETKSSSSSSSNKTCNNSETNCRTTSLAPSRSEASLSASSGCSVNQNKCRTSEVKASLPPVIMVPYEGMEGMGGVTFGFEPNEQLLALDPKSLLDQPPNAQFGPVPSRIDVTSRYRPLLQEKLTYNFEATVEYIEKSWLIVKQQLHKSNPNPENTQYYCV